MIEIPESAITVEASSAQAAAGGPFNHPFMFRDLVAHLKSTRIPVLGGFIELRDVMGHERDVAADARVTSQLAPKAAEDDVNLLRYLLRHRHTTPFEMVELKFHVRVAMDTWRQWIRHRTASVNEYSTRYTEAIDDCQTADGNWRAQATVNRQGSNGTISDEWPEGYVVVPLDEYHDRLSIVDDNEHKLWGILYLSPENKAADNDPDLMAVVHGSRASITPTAYLSEREASGQHQSREVYEERLRFGVAKELARKDLPLSTMTEAVWKVNLHNLMHFLSLRMDSHAQLEIRSYANAIGEIVKLLYPVTWEAFSEYRLNAMQLTSKDIATIQNITTSTHDAPVSHGLFLELCHPSWHGLERCRERDECEAKLRRLKLVV